MKLSIISDQISDDLESACKVIQAAAYTHVELHNVFGKSIEECSDEEVARIKCIVGKYNLKVSNIASTIFFLCPLYEGYTVSLFNDHFHAIKGDVETHLHYLDRACKIADALSCDTIRIFPFRYPDNPNNIVVGTKKDRDAICEKLQMALPIAKAYQKTLVLENCPYSHCPKGAMTYDIVQSIHDEHLQLLWDPANSFRAEKHQVPHEFLALNLMEECALLKNKVGHIHLKNYTYDSSLDKPFVHTALGEGDIDYVALSTHMPQDVAWSLESEVDYEKTIASISSLSNIVSNL